MIVTLVHVHVKPDCVDGFITATLGNHAGSVAEAGNRRFDLLQDPADPARFIIYEAFLSEDDIAGHKLTAHYLAWRQAVDGMMAEQRFGVRWTPLALKE
jgi:autoinducer 2-degrading protein